MSLERGDLATASEQAERLATTVDHMLALARNALPQPALVQIGPIVDAAAGRWRHQFQRVDRQLVAEIGANLPAVHARDASVDQALDVLLENALRHGDGTVRLTARPAAGGLVVQVADDGPGIRPDAVPTIFRRAEGTGSGVGLPLARALVEADGGRLVLADPDHAELRIVLAAATDAVPRSDG